MIQHSSTYERNPGRPSEGSEFKSTMEQVCHYIEENPASSVLIGLGVGFGAGVALGALLRGSTGYFQPDRSFTERLGHQVAESLSGVLPKGWRNSFRT